MEAITADSIFFIILVGDRIHIGLGRHCGMERSIKYHNLRKLFAKYLLAGKNPFQLWAIVQRGQWDQAANSLDDLIVDQNRLPEN